MNTLVIPQKIKREIKQVSASLGVSPNDLALNAIVYYMKSIKDRLDFKSEMDAWERVSDEDFLKFEKSI